MRTSFCGWILLLLTISACSKTNVFENTPNFEKEKITDYYSRPSGSLRSSRTTPLNVEELREYLLQKYTQGISPNNVNNTYPQYGKIGSGYNFFSGTGEKVVGVELESPDNIRFPILTISEETVDNIDINPLNSLTAEVRTYQDFKKDFSEFFHSVTDSKSFSASADFQLSWLAKASASYKNSLEKETKQGNESSSKTVFTQASVLIKSKRVAYNIGSIKRFSPETNLTPHFFIDYHLMSAEQLIDRYGRFILTNYNFFLGGEKPWQPLDIQQRILKLLLS